MNHTYVARNIIHDPNIQKVMYQHSWQIVSDLEEKAIHADPILKWPDGTGFTVNLDLAGIPFPTIDQYGFKVGKVKVTKDRYATHVTGIEFLMSRLFGNQVSRHLLLANFEETVRALGETGFYSHSFPSISQNTDETHGFTLSFRASFGHEYSLSFYYSRPDADTEDEPEEPDDKYIHIKLLGSELITHEEMSEGLRHLFYLLEKMRIPTEDWRAMLKSKTEIHETKDLLRDSY